MNPTLLHKFFLNECDAKEIVEVIGWMLNPSNDATLKIWMKENWDKIPTLTTDQDLDVEKIWTKIHATLKLEVYEQELLTQHYNQKAQQGKQHFYRKMIFKVGSIAAALILIISTFFLLTIRKNSTNIVALEKNLDRINNTESKSKIVTLEDGTKVSLGSNATIFFPKKFGLERRELTLEGDAFFEVAKNPDRPFLVYTKDIITKVLGTSFSINSNKNSNDVVVSVVTGKVQVFEKNESNLIAVNSKTLSTKGILLTPNQQVVYTANKQIFETSIVENPEPIQYLKLSQNYFDFDRTSLQTIVERIQKSYGIEIVLENDELNKCNFSGDISEESLYEKLDLICKSIGATYQASGTRILIRGKGCKK